MKIYRIPTLVQYWAIEHVEAESLEDAMEKVSKSDHIPDPEITPIKNVADPDTCSDYNKKPDRSRA